MRPNILFIMADDHAAHAIGAYDGRLASAAPTPNIDRLAREGMRFDHCHCTNAICSPSRASILTGRHSHACGVRTLEDPLPEDAVLLAELLNGDGYQTALFGKWHLHVRPRGFDDWAVFPGQGQYHDPVFVYAGRDRFPDGAEPFDDPDSLPGYHAAEARQASAYGVLARCRGYVTDLVTDMSIDWLRRRDRERPFFLCCHHKAPHDFFEYAPRDERIFDGVVFAEPSTLFEPPDVLMQISRKYGSSVSERWQPRNMVKHLMDPEYPNGGPVDFSGLDFEGRARKAYQKYMLDYLRTVRALDDNVGRILNELDALGLTDDTIVVYTSDQGMMLGEHDKIDKRWIFEESQRMPFLVRYPREIPAGAVNDDVVDNTDMAPTFLDMAGVPIPSNMQGRSFRSALCGETPGDWRQSTYFRYWMHMAHHGVPAHYGIRTRTRKLVFFYGLKLDATGCTQPECDQATEPGFELYDLDRDPEETRNVYGDPAYAEDAESLKRELLTLKEEFGDRDDRFPELEALRKTLW